MGSNPVSPTTNSQAEIVLHLLEHELLILLNILDTIGDFSPVILILGTLVLIFVKEEKMQMKLMFACFFIGLYAQFGQSWLVFYWGEGCCGLDDTLWDESNDSWKLVITRILLGFGTLFAFICVMVENRKSSLSINQKMDWEKWSLTTARLAGGLTLIAPLFWYISFRMSGEYYDDYTLGMTFRLVILAGILGLLATKEKFSQYDRLTSSVSDAMHRTNMHKSAQFSIVVIFFSMFMPYYQILGLGITGGELFLTIIELIFFSCCCHNSQ